MSKRTQIDHFAAQLSKSLTPFEMAFLRRLTMANVTSFDFQVAIGFYIVDFVFPIKMLVIELDGACHKGREDYDRMRDEFLTRAGFTVWRVPNDEAASFPLGRIREFERPLTSRPYAEALLWAQREYADKKMAPKKRELFFKNLERSHRNAIKQWRHKR